jgi:hypothetical protein
MIVITPPQKEFEMSILQWQQAEESVKMWL